MSETKKSTRSSRDSGAHVNQARRQPWRPVRTLETPPAPPGYVYRWIRESMLGSEDRANVSRRLREGWELVRGTDLPPEFELPTLDNGRHEGLLLAKIPEETVKERNEYYADKTETATAALDNNIFNEAAGDSRYVKYNPSRSSRVSFGKQ